MISQTGWIVLLLVTAFVVYIGGTVERMSALLNFLNWLLYALFQPARASIADVFPWADLCIDVVFAFLFVLFTLRTQRGWMALLSAFLILGVANDLSYLFDRKAFQRAFMTAAYFWAYGALACLAYGGWSARRMRRSKGLVVSERET